MIFRKKTNKQEALPQKTVANNPYLNARTEWLERYGSYISRAAQWRAVAFFCLIIAGISITGNVIQASHAKVVPYIVKMDELGHIAAVGRADRASPTPRVVIQAEISNVIQYWRTVTADIDLQQKMIDRLSFFVAGSAKGVVREHYTLKNPYEISKKGQLVHVEVKGLPLPVSSDSYRVEWTETTRSHAGIELNKQTFEATVTVQINPPISDAIIVKNPGGVYITNLAVARLYGVAPTVSSVPNSSENTND